MKFILSLALLAATATLVTAQPTPPALPVAQAGEVRTVERGPHHRVLGWTVAEPTPDGGTRAVEHRVVELATGMHYLRNGQWQENARPGPNTTVWTRAPPCCKC